MPSVRDGHGPPARDAELDFPSGEALTVRPEALLDGLDGPGLRYGGKGRGQADGLEEPAPYPGETSVLPMTDDLSPEDGIGLVVLPEAFVAESPNKEF